MIILLLIILLLIVSYVIIAPKNLIIWYFALYMLGFSVILIACLFFVFKLNNYPNLYYMDYWLYLYISKLSVSLPSVRNIFTAGIALILFANVFFIIIINIGKKQKYLLLLIGPILIYCVLNNPDVNQTLYLFLHSAISPTLKQLVSSIPYITENYIKALLLIYHLLPILAAIASYRETTIQFKKNSIIITLICMILLFINIFSFMFSELKIYLGLNFLDFPILPKAVSLHILIPSSFLCIITLIFCMLIFFYPFRSFTITTSKGYHSLSNINTKNLRMLFHMQKNIFVVISKFSQLSLEDCEKDPQAAFNHLKVIKDLSDNTVENLTKNLNYLKAVDTVKECISIYKIINDALAKTNLPEGITVDKIYPTAALECYINLESITECFVNLLSNAIEAIEASQSDKGKITIMIDYDYDLISVSIIDNGCGIDKKDIKHIFKPLFSTKASQKNYGLGLSYTKNIIQKNNGYIKIKSKPNIGTTAQLILPRYNKRRFDLWKK